MATAVEANDTLLKTIQRLAGTTDQDHWIGGYNTVRTLGKGATGTVKYAHSREDISKEVAIKIVDKQFMMRNPLEKKRIEREIECLKLLDHPYIMKLHEVQESATHKYMVLEYLPGGELYDMLLKRGRLPLDSAFKYFFQITMAVAHMHRMGVVHRDIKLENVIVDSNNDIKLADFGMAVRCSRLVKLEESVGSPHYCCPEIVKGEKYSGYEADLWSLGVVLFILVTGQLPFDAESKDLLFQKIKEGNIQYPAHMSDNAKDLVSRILKVRGNERCSLGDIQASDWWKSRCDRITPDMRKIWDEEFPPEKYPR